MEWDGEGPPGTRVLTPLAQVKMVELSLKAFVEVTESSVCRGVPQRCLYSDTLKAQSELWSPLIEPGIEMERKDKIIAAVSASMVYGSSDMETEQCREQEQERGGRRRSLTCAAASMGLQMPRSGRARVPASTLPVTDLALLYLASEQEEEREQEMELERYVDMAYARDSEEPTRWAFLRLKEKGGMFCSGSFYPASKLRLPGRAPLPFPSFLGVSRNHFDLDWQGDRRLKNATMVLEWIPSASELTTCTAAGPTRQQTEILSQACAMLDLDGSSRFGAREIAVMLAAVGDVPPLGDDGVAQILADVGAETLSATQLINAVVSGKHRREETGRFFVLLSLAEAETIRAILHLRQGKAIIDGSDAGLALRCVPAGDIVFDASDSFPLTPSCSAVASHVCFRFVDSVMHFKPHEIAVLLRCIPASPEKRRCRRLDCNLALGLDTWLESVTGADILVALAGCGSRA